MEIELLKLRMERCGMMNRKKIKHINSALSIFMLLAITISLVGCGKTEDKAVAPSEKPKESFIEAQGVVKTTKSANITLDFSAKILDIKVKEGQGLKLNDPIMELDISDYLKRIKDAQNQLSIEKLNLEKLIINTGDGIVSGKSTITNLNNLKAAREEYSRINEQLQKRKFDLNNGSDPEVEKAKIRVETTRLEFKRAEQDYDYWLKKYSDILISFNELKTYERLMQDRKKSYEDAVIGYENAKNNSKNYVDNLSNSASVKLSQIQNLELELSTAKVSSKKDVDISNERIKSLELDLKNLQSKLDKPYLKGNMVISMLNNAVISDIRPKVGDMVQAGTFIAELIDVLNLVVEIDISEDVIKDVKINSKVKIVPLADSTKVYDGKLLKISDVGKEKEGETIFIGEVSIDKKDTFLKSGLNVEARIMK